MRTSLRKEHTLSVLSYRFTSMIRAISGVMMEEKQQYLAPEAEVVEVRVESCVLSGQLPDPTPAEEQGW